MSAVVSLEAPLSLQMMAARGAVPGASARDIVSALVVLSRRGPVIVKELAVQTLEALPSSILEGAARSQLHPAVVSMLADGASSPDGLVSRLLQQPHFRLASLAQLAEEANDQVAELIASKETRLLAQPAVIEALYRNPRVRAATICRLIALAVRQNVTLSLPAYREVQRRHARGGETSSLRR